MKILNVKQISDERWLNLYDATYEKNGKRGSWVYASRRKPGESTTAPDAVMIVPILRARGQRPRLILQKEYRIPLGTHNYAFPAGLLDEGEGIEETVRRELLEETGLELVKIKRVSPGLTSSAGLTDESLVMAFVDARKPKGAMRQQLEPAEEIEVLALDYDDVRRFCDAPDLQIDAKTWTVLFLYQQMGKLD